MSATKYANLPDIDTAQDIYETEDIFPSQVHGESSDDDALPTRLAIRSRAGEISNSQELDVGHLIDTEEASKKFRKAEKKRARHRTRYAYPPSATQSGSSSADEETSRPIPLSRRLKGLQAELSSLEAELVDPSSPLFLNDEVNDANPGELLRGLVDVRGRVNQISRSTEGRGKLVKSILSQQQLGSIRLSKGEEPKPTLIEDEMNETRVAGDIHNLVEMDRRVAELERLLGTSTTAVDETSPLPLPLATQITRIHYQLQALTTPRHIDNISRRLKLLMTDLDRVSNAHTHKRHPSHPNADPSVNAKITNDIIPILHRLNPALPQIPHILTRLRTLSTLHRSAGEFRKDLESLEDEQAQIKESLDELESAIVTVEKSLEENRKIVGGNVEGLEKRVDDLSRRLDELDRIG
ncbi:Dynamitin-domain-containing protein [Lentinula aff. lateritia]|uniref:Dynamitin-domain-containing protein n=1 Tax=Lentinula aff. lateritia TaxID=2804960 RepID=A0ACC1TRQ8_9AGAR|nr:Dynamitin-domain-containing protein [Lentinula aff. lateritia]